MPNKSIKPAMKEDLEMSNKASNRGGFSKPMKVSPELADIIGTETASRGECTRYLWAYFKKNNLQDTENKHYIHPDEKLAKVFGKDMFKALGMMKYLTQHLSNME